MKSMMVILCLIMGITYNLKAQTNWEKYVQNPTEKNANKVKKIAYSSTWISGELDEKNLRLIEQKIKELDTPSLELAFRVLSGDGIGWGGASNTRVREAISKIIKKNPNLYLDALNNANVKKCIAIEPVGEKYVDHPCLLAKDGVALFEVFNKLESSNLLYQTCFNDLKGYIEVNSECILKSKTKQYNKNFSKTELPYSKELLIKQSTELIGFGCGTGCAIQYQRISDIKILNSSIKRAYYESVKLMKQEVVSEDKEYIYAKCHENKKYELSFGNQNNYFSIEKELTGGMGWAYKKIAFDLCQKPSKSLKFINYATDKTYQLLNKPLIQKGFGRLYRTLLKKALKEKKVEFAGKHIIAQWGCDDGKKECTTGGIIDASTGKATEFPFKYYAHNGSKEIIYKLNSSLIIFSGDFEFKNGRREENKVLFYEFKNGEFLFLKASEYKK